MNKIIFIVMLLLFAVFSFSACSISGSKLDDTEWFLKSYGDQDDLRAIIDGTEITATFDNVEDKLSGSAGCNTYFAQYKTKGNELLISEMAYTEMYCLSPEGVMEQEQEFLSLLEKAQSFEVDRTMLTISCSNGQQLYFTTATM